VVVGRSRNGTVVHVLRLYSGEAPGNKRRIPTSLSNRSHQALGTNSEQFCVGASNDLRLDLDLECDIVFVCCSKRDSDGPKGQRETGESAAWEGPEGKEVSSGGQEGVGAAASLLRNPIRGVGT